jgi:hypothetical protein
MTNEEAAAFIAGCAWGPGADAQLAMDDPIRAVRHAVRRHHPDHGGDEEQLRRILEARDVLTGRNPA